MAGLVYKGFSERLYRAYLEETGVVATGEVIGHRLYHCLGLFCSRRSESDGAYGSEAFNAYLDSCRGRSSGGCHFDLIVRFQLGGELFEIEEKVRRDRFLEIAPGSEIAVLVNRNDPRSSLLRDHNPQGFLFWIAVLLILFVIFIAGVLFPNRARWRLQ